MNRFNSVHYQQKGYCICSVTNIISHATQSIRSVTDHLSKLKHKLVVFDKN